MKKGRSLWNQLLEVIRLHLFVCWLLSFVFERWQSQTGKRQYEGMTEFSSSSSTLERTVEGCTNRFSLKLFEISFQINFPPKICSTSQIARFFDRQYLSDERWSGLIFFADRHTHQKRDLILGGCCHAWADPWIFQSIAIQNELYPKEIHHYLFCY